MGELTAEAVVDRLVPREPRISPDGRWVVYVTAPVGRVGKHPVSGLWLAPADGSAPARQIAGGEAEHRAPRWAADSGSVFFLSDRDERGTAQLYRIGLDGGAAERLTEWAGGISGHVPLPGIRGADRAGREGPGGRPAGPDHLPADDVPVRRPPTRTRQRPRATGHVIGRTGPRSVLRLGHPSPPDRLWLLDLRTSVHPSARRPR